jgi:hypothetical protein
VSSGPRPVYGHPSTKMLQKKKNVMSYSEFFATRKEMESRMRCGLCSKHGKNIAWARCEAGLCLDLYFKSYNTDLHI